MTTSMKQYMMQTNLYAAEKKIEELEQARQLHIRTMEATLERVEALERRCAQLELESRKR